MAAKARRYLRGGTRLVWVVWPGAQAVDVRRPGDDAPGTTLGRGGMLDGEGVVPGFLRPVAEIFDV